MKMELPFSFCMLVAVRHHVRFHGKSFKKTVRCQDLIERNGAKEKPKKPGGFTRSYLPAGQYNQW
jgi:hypothetical protein